MTPRLPRPTPDTSGTPVARVALRIGAWLGAPLLIAYPILVYYSMQHYSARAVAVVLLLGISPFLLRVFGSRRKTTDTDPASVGNRRSWQWIWPVLAISLIGGALLANSVRSLLLVPVCINGGLLLSFGSTLWDERPLIERFARIQHPDLTFEERHWCRLWTIIWTAFFAFNVVLAGLFTLTHSVEWWTYYNGLIAYVVMGTLFTSEYVVRKYRFRRFAEHGLDRGLRWCLLKMGLLQ